MTSVANLFFGFCNSSNGGRYPNAPLVINQNINIMDASPRANMLQNQISTFFKIVLSIVIYLSTISYSALHFSFNHAASSADSMGAVSAYTHSWYALIHAISCGVMRLRSIIWVS